MKMKKFFALLLTGAMVLSLAACGKKEEAAAPAESGGEQAAASTLHLGVDPETGEEFYGPYYDEWSDMTDDQLYEQALKEDVTINIYATSSKMLKAEEPFEEMYPGLDVVVSDLDSDEVLNKAKIEHDSGNVTADVLQTKDVNGSVFYEWYNQGIIEPFYPRDICAHIDEGNLKYSYPLYASQAFWYYNTEAFPDGQPINNWWQIIEKDENGNQKYRSPRRSARSLRTCPCSPASSTTLTRWKRPMRTATAKSWSTPIMLMTSTLRFPRTTPAWSTCGASARPR